MKKMYNMLDIYNNSYKKNKRMVKEITKLKTNEINELVKKSITGVGCGLFLLLYGIFVKKYGISLNSNEIEALSLNPKTMYNLFNLFSGSLISFGAVITFIEGKKAYQRNKEITELKRMRKEIENNLKPHKKITEEEKKELKNIKVQKYSV